jgi:hypothetical protein
MKREPRRACAAHAANHLSSGPARAGMLRARALSADLRSVHAPESLASRTPAPATVSARPPAGPLARLRASVGPGEAGRWGQR